MLSLLSSDSRGVLQIIQECSMLFWVSAMNFIKREINFSASLQMLLNLSTIKMYLWKFVQKFQYIYFLREMY